jgi:hypothetical protein
MKIGLTPQAGQRKRMARQKYRQAVAVVRGSFTVPGYDGSPSAERQDIYLERV